MSVHDLVYFIINALLLGIIAYDRAVTIHRLRIEIDSLKLDNKILKDTVLDWSGYINKLYEKLKFALEEIEED